MKTHLLAVGAALFCAAALVACGGGGGGGTPPGPTPTATPTSTQTPISNGNVTLGGTQQVAALPAVGGFGGTITVPTGSGSVQITDSTTNPSSVSLQSKTGARPDATSTPNPYGCVGSTPYSVTAPRNTMALPPHPIASGESFAYSGTVSTTFTQSAPCPEPTSTSSATASVSVAATATSLPGVSGTVSDLRSSEADAFPTLTTTTITDQYVQNAANGYVLYEQKSSNTTGDSLDINYGSTNAQLLDTSSPSSGQTWSNAPTAAMSESLADGTSIRRTIASNGTYTETESFPTTTLNTKTPLLFVTITAQSNVTMNGIPGFTVTVPSGVTGSVSLAILQNAVWTTVQGPATVTGGSVTFAPASGTITLSAGQTVYLALFQANSSTVGGGSASITVNSDGSGVYNVAGTSFNYAAPASGNITLTIGSGSGAKTRTFPAWFSVPTSYITDSFVDNGQQAFDTHCNVNAVISASGDHQIVETYKVLDPVLGYQETRTTTSYVVPGFGAACVAIDDTLNSYYDYQNDTTRIDYQSQNGSPNSVNHLVEYLGMSSPATAYTSARTRSSVQPVSPMAVAERVNAIQLQREGQRARLVRAMRDALILESRKGAAQ